MKNEQWEMENSEFTNSLTRFDGGVFPVWKQSNLPFPICHLPFFIGLPKPMANDK
jgi:hypothetical protein